MTSCPQFPVAFIATPFPPEQKPDLAARLDRQIDNVILDLGDVLFTWSTETETSIAPITLRRILHSSLWFEYERGNLTEDETYHLVAGEFSLDVAELAAAFRAMRDTLQSNSSMFALLHELKRNSDLRLFAMSNISAPDWEFLRRIGRPVDWALFDQVFTSAVVRERKPDLGFFRHVLESTGINPRRTAFVDDKLENVVSAQSVGLKAIVYSSFDEVARELRTLVRNPVVDGERYLRENAREMKTVTNTGVILEENFFQLLILELTGDPTLVDYIKYPRLCNFFKLVPMLTTDSYPCDLDTTSVACTVSDHFSPEAKNEIMDEILLFRNKDGFPLTYFDVSRPRLDPIVCINALTFFYSNGRGSELKEAFDWVYEVLKNRAYTNGTYYYRGPDPFFFFLSRLLSVSVYARQEMGSLFVKRITERFGTEGDALALAMRIHAAAAVDLYDKRDYDRLVRMQEADGSWPTGWIVKYGVSANILMGNTGLTTALAVSAIRGYKEVERRLHSFDY